MNATEISSPAPKNSQNWSDFRTQMPVSRKWAYFDHACVAPIPQPAFDAISRWASQSLLEGDTIWPSWDRQHENLRNLTAQCINAAPEEVALVPNTTFGINLVADGFPWQSGDNVVIPDHEFPSNLYPWMALQSRGVELRRVELEGHRVCPNRIADACDERTRVISASWIGYGSGYRLDPAEIAQVAHDQGALFFLDAIQGLGVFPLDVVDANIDFLAADGHKWLLGPEGAGVFYSKQEHLEILRPMNVGWNSVKQGNDFANINLDVRNEARRYEGGTQNMAGFIGLGASLQLLADFGLTCNQSPIGDQVLALTDEILTAFDQAGVKVLSDREPAAKSGIVSFEVPGKSSPDLKAHLFNQGVVVSQRQGRLRTSAHCYNNTNDIDRLIESIKSFG